MHTVYDQDNDFAPDDPVHDDRDFEDFTLPVPARLVIVFVVGLVYGSVLTRVVEASKTRPTPYSCLSAQSAHQRLDRFEAYEAGKRAAHQERTEP